MRNSWSLAMTVSRASYRIMTRFYRIIYAIAAPIIHLLFPCRTVGLEDFPEEGALLCANHASGWDPILIALNLPKDARLTVMAKAAPVFPGQWPGSRRASASVRQ